MLTSDDILRPEIVNVQGRRYRKLPIRGRRYAEEERPRETYIEDDHFYYDEPESCANEYESIEKTVDGYCDSIKDIPQFYYRFIIGPKRSTKESIESQTNSFIRLPVRGSERGDIVITSKERSGVIAAKSKVQTIIDMKRGEQSPDHFFSIPLTSPELTGNFKKFKSEVLKLEAKGMDGSLFQFPERLHLTLGLAIFLNKKELEDSIGMINEIITSTRKKHFGDERIAIHLKGIEYMNDDPSEVDVLYAKVHLHNTNDSSNLQNFVNEIISQIAEKGFVQKQYERVKLHATIINSLFRDRKKDTDRTSDKYYAKKRERFDAREIMKNFSDFDFGVYIPETIDVSIRGKFDKDGHYQREAFFNLMM